MRLVFDTNVLLAALATNGVCAELFNHCTQHHSLILSEPILAEVRDKLVRKFRYSLERTEVAVAALRDLALVVVPTVLPGPICRDPDDDMILATALAGGARCIITGDKDLLVLEHYETVDIIRPADFAAYETAHISDAP